MTDGLNTATLSLSLFCSATVVSCTHLRHLLPLVFSSLSLSFSCSLLFGGRTLPECQAQREAASLSLTVVVMAAEDVGSLEAALSDTFVSSTATRRAAER